MNPYSPPGYAPQYPPAGYPPVAPYGAGQPGTVSELAIEHLRNTRPWVMLLSILCFIGTAFMVMAGFSIGALSLAQSRSAIPGWLGLVYVPLGALYVYPGIKMWMFGSAIGRLVVSRGVAELEVALGQQKSFWKFCGIAALVTIAVYAVALAGMMAFGFSQVKHGR